MIGRRFIESESYKDARARGIIATGEFDFEPVPVASAEETRSLLNLRAKSNLPVFDIDGNPYVAELAGAAHLPGIVETIPVENIQVLLAEESSESPLATAVDYGQPYPEAQVNFGATASRTKLERFGTAIPVTLGQLDEPGVVESIIDRRLNVGIQLGLENDILNGNGFWTGAVAAAGTTTAKGATTRADALCNAIANVQAAGWYIRPLQIAIHPTTRAATYTEMDNENRPLPIREMLEEVIDTWVISKEVPVGTALVGDFFEAVGLFTNGGLDVAVAKNHEDFFTRSMVELSLGFRCYAWVRQPTALTTVTGL